ncbi:MAG: hypothetical protein H6918_05205 [Sphingomonadaceae bacterium]|nr:hypothetical protein [Sphingomonadaceae bacterium]
MEFVLRSAFHLQNLAPTPLKRLLGEPVEESVYEPLLEKDLLSAALCLVETPVQKGGMPQLQAAFDEKASREMGKAEQQKLAKDVLLTWLLALLEFSTQLPSAPGRTRQ